MQRDFPEADWRHWRKVSAAALERFCAQALHDAARLEHAEGSAHARYQRLFQLLRERDETIAAIFDDQRRSTAYRQIATAADRGILTPEELAGLSAGTQDFIRVL